MNNMNAFIKYASTDTHPDWELLIQRQNNLYHRDDDIRSPFGRDYTRILHCLAYRRLKHKTQVFFNTNNDHICTRMEHVSHVESVSFSVAKYLGLNTELTKAIASGHDIGHAPFGHQGEAIIKSLCKKHLKEDFWHEKNGLRFVDKLELLEDDKRLIHNLNLTYAVRDGIISHCGEIDENELIPRTEYIDLNDYSKPNQYKPITWEGCLVKLADKIAYIGRDIEDAQCLNFIDKSKQLELLKIVRKYKVSSPNTTAIMHSIIIDLCKNSNPCNGLKLSTDNFEMLKEVKCFNYSEIYKNRRFESYRKFSNLVLNEIFDSLLNAYSKNNTIIEIIKRMDTYPELYKPFFKWLLNYLDTKDATIEKRIKLASDNDKAGYIDLWEKTNSNRNRNEKIYGKLSSKKTYVQAIIDYISGMTDKYAIRVFHELIRF